jgi:MFS-type transporter involved in bile tolerance (Atg22 family)
MKQPESQTTKRISYSLFAALLIPLLAWCAGYDFDKRGAVACFICVYSILLFLFVWFAPWWKYDR